MLHLRYRTHDGATAVRFDARTDEFEILRPDRPVVRVRPAVSSAGTTPVLTAIHTRPRANRAFWAAYETLRFDFAPASGLPPLLLTSAVLDLAPVVAWLRTTGVAVTERRRWLAWA